MIRAFERSTTILQFNPRTNGATFNIETLQFCMAKTNFRHTAERVEPTIEGPQFKARPRHFLRHSFLIRHGDVTQTPRNGRARRELDAVLRPSERAGLSRDIDPSEWGRGVAKREAVGGWVGRSYSSAPAPRPGPGAGVQTLPYFAHPSLSESPGAIPHPPTPTPRTGAVFAFRKIVGSGKKAPAVEFGLSSPAGIYP